MSFVVDVFIAVFVIVVGVVVYVEVASYDGALEWYVSFEIFSQNTL